MRLRDHAKRFFRRLGYDVRQFNALNTPLARRLLLLDHYDIDLIIDVGANTGRYARDMRRNGYRHRIVSFEPLSSAYEELARQAQQDPLWHAENVALGDREGHATINVARNTECSSLMDVTARFTASTPNATFVDTEDITIRTLDAVFQDVYREGERAYLKIDTQGYEKRVLEGASHALAHILGVQMELSLVRLYDEETLFADMLTYMADRGFTLMSIEPVNASGATGQLLQVDGLFFRE